MSLCTAPTPARHVGLMCQEGRRYISPCTDQCRHILAVHSERLSDCESVIAFTDPAYIFETDVIGRLFGRLRQFGIIKGRGPLGCRASHLHLSMCNADNVLSFHNRMIDGVLLYGSYTYIAISAANATRQWWPLLSIINNKIPNVRML